MTDSPLSSDAWITDPQTYFDRRAASHTVPTAPVSRYLTMRDGVRLAVDIHLPDGERPTPMYSPTRSIRSQYEILKLLPIRVRLLRRMHGKSHSR